ncbi:outer membrane efflux protein [Cyanobacterium stanieri PCC 7202]|uniref:Outer membrane efflux protein n=1 Tax=Cyanobacterium stanieri (strain ATCC 29140 / PCC 7202) TaxID=292563 RepID=K9YLT6_CYASC|nr:outer membrane efflux protein [Cyanobacterium stanieri PCC 7202]
MFYKKGLNLVLSCLILGFGWGGSVQAQESDSPLNNSNISPMESSNGDRSNRNQLLRPSEPQDVRIEGLTAITLEEAIDIALDNNRDLQRAKLELQRSRESLRAAEAQKRVFVDGSANVTETGNQSSGFLGNTNTFGAGAGVEVGYRLSSGGRISATINRAREEIKVSDLEVDKITQDTVFRVSTAYYQLQNSDAQVNIAEAAVEDFTQTLRDAQLLERAGLGTRFDVLQAEVDLANANQALTRAVADQRNARRELARVIGVPENVEYSSADEVEERGEWNLPLEESIVLAYSNREELDQILALREINRQNREIALSERRPQVNLFANYNFNTTFADSRPLSSTGYSDGYAIGARLQWRFVDGGESAARAEQEEISIAIDENNFDDQKSEIRLEVETAYNDLIANRDNIATTEQAAVTATESLRLARLRFQAGVGTQTDVINAQRALTEARGNFLQAIIGYNQSLNRLQRAVGQYE